MPTSTFGRAQLQCHAYFHHQSADTLLHGGFQTCMHLVSLALQGGTAFSQVTDDSAVSGRLGGLVQSFTIVGIFALNTF